MCSFGQEVSLYTISRGVMWRSSSINTAAVSLALVPYLRTIVYFLYNKKIVVIGIEPNQIFPCELPLEIYRNVMW